MLRAIITITQLPQSLTTWPLLHVQMGSLAMMKPQIQTRLGYSGHKLSEVPGDSFPTPGKGTEKRTQANVMSTGTKDMACLPLTGISDSSQWPDPRTKLPVPAGGPQPKIL